MASIEVEIRGKIEDFDKVLGEFRKKAKFIREKKRISFIYFRNEVVKDVKEIKEEKVDLRARITDRKAELIMKYGDWGGSDSRREISLPIEIENFEEAIDFLRFLGWDRGVVIPTETFVFDYEGVEFALVKNSHFKYFEAEEIVDNQKKVESVNKHLLTICREFNLKPFKEEEFIHQINTLNNIKENQFDFSKQSFSLFRKMFKEYF